MLSVKWMECFSMPASVLRLHQQSPEVSVSSDLSSKVSSFLLSVKPSSSPSRLLKSLLTLSLYEEQFLKIYWVIQKRNIRKTNKKTENVVCGSEAEQVTSPGPPWAWSPGQSASQRSPVLGQSGTGQGYCCSTQTCNWEVPNLVFRNKACVDQGTHVLPYTLHW